MKPALVALLMSGSLLVPQTTFADERPNILLVLVDDMGFSDLGCYGGEIRTPNLDRLADHGLRFSQFYNCAKCETTRATLISGRYHSEVSVGRLANCVTIAEAMRLAGYTTLMTGKWHLGSTPVQRGFDHYFGHLSGACNTPFREYKRNQHEGGISTPLIAHWPRGIAKPGSITREVGHLVDT